MKRLISFLLSILISLLFFSLPTQTAAASKPSVSANGYILLEKDDLYRIAGCGENLRLPPASTTKIVTCLVVLENASLDETVTVSKNAASVEGSSAYLRAGERVSVKDLLYCLMLSSANDAATALAEHVAGNTDNFAFLMNEKVRQLGLVNTHFTNPHGLDNDAHYTSPYDLAVITCAALSDSRFKEIVSTKRYSACAGESRRDLVNHNRLLFSLDGCVGVKTGYTVRSGRCLVSACERDGTTLVCVTLGCHDDWDTHASLFSYGFSRVKRQNYNGITMKIPLAVGRDSQITVNAGAYSFLSDADATAEFRVFCPHYLLPPVKKGEMVGRIAVILDGKETASIPLYAAENAVEPEKPGFFSRLFRFISSIFD